MDLEKRVKVMENECFYILTLIVEKQHNIVCIVDCNSMRYFVEGKTYSNKSSRLK
jgi:hypothetical protein